MSVQQYNSAASRIGKFKGAIFAHAIPMESLSRQGRSRELPMNQSDTYVGRRYLPYGATSTNANTINQFFANGTGDRTAVIVQAHQTQEGVTPGPDSLTPVDATVVIQQYSCLYSYTDKTADLYEDDIPAQMKIQVGERVTFVREMIRYSALKAGTNVYYGGTGTSIATVNGSITLNLVRKIVKNIQANHAKPVNRMLSASPKYGTDAVAEGYLVFCHTDMEPDIRDLPGFTPTEKYASGTPLQGEIGKCERFRFIGHPDLASQQDAGAAIGATGLYSTTGSNIDVYQCIVMAQDAWSSIALRGKRSLDPTSLPTGQKTKSDPFGQRGYVGTIWWDAVLLENNGWMAVLNVGVKSL